MSNNNPVDHGKESNKRIWSLYNESLVRPMKDILDLKDIENYRLDLMKQNVRKNGRPFITPDKIIEILARIRAVFNASFRSLESYMRIFREILGIPRISNSSIFRRIRNIKVPEIMNTFSVAIDSTGFKTTIRGDWMSNKWAKKRRGWIKLHVSADTERIMALKPLFLRDRTQHIIKSVSLEGKDSKGDQETVGRGMEAFPCIWKKMDC